MNNRIEFWTVAGIIIFIVLCSIAPYLYGYLNTPDGLYYLGVRLNNFPDSNSYLSWIFQGGSGNVLFKQLYSTEGSQLALFHPVFLILGFLMKISGGLPIFWYHLGRVIAIGVFTFSGYSLIKNLISEKKWRIVALIVFLSSSGLGWLFGFSADNTQIEATNFINMHESLLNPLSLALILWVIIVFYYKNYKTVKTVLICGALLNILILIHSYDFIVVSSILSLIVIYKVLYRQDYQSLTKLLYIFIACFPAIVFQIYALEKNEALGIWAFLQSSVPAVPSFAYYLSGVGLQIIFLSVGLFALKKDQREKWLPWIIWLFLLPVFLWNPFLIKYQRKLAIGAFIPIALFTFIGIKWFFYWVRENIKYKQLAKYIMAGLIFLLSVTNIMILIGDFNDVRNNLPYINSNIKSAIDYLQKQQDGRVFSTPFIGNLIPGFTGKTVYIGHYDQTVNFNQKAALTQNLFISTASNKDPLKFFVKQEQINYIFVDEEVRSWGGLDVTNRPYLKLVYENPDVRIYQIQKDLLN